MPLRTPALLLLLPLALFGCTLPSITIPLPQQCQRVEGPEMPGLPGLPHGTYDTDYTVPLGDALQTGTGAVDLSAWISFLQATAVQGDLDFLESLSVSAAAPGDGGEPEWIDLATFHPGVPGEVGPIAILATTGADLLPLIPADGDLPVRLRFVGQPPETPLKVNLTACVAGEVHYQL